MEELYLEICFQEREDTLIIDVPEEHLELIKAWIRKLAEGEEDNLFLDVEDDFCLFVNGDEVAYAHLFFDDGMDLFDDDFDYDDEFLVSSDEEDDLEQ